MNERPADITEMLRRALAAQVELGLGEMIIAPRTENVKVEKKESGTIGIKKQTEPGNLFSSTEQPVMEAQFGSLEEHRQAICDCQLCPLGATRTNFVYGVGNPNADLMFIGEAPGRDEDLKGEPFVGRAGQLLDKILTAMNLSRQEIYIANILKCRPPNNRDPQPDEMEKCFPYLREQVHLIKPKMICALGRIAAQALLQTSTPLGKLRGQWHEYEGIPTIVTYHPAALLRFPSYKKETWKDMQTLMAQLQQSE